MAKRDAFITIKDHKENFPSNVKCRLINPSKGELGKVSKVILDNINNNIRSAINIIPQIQIVQSGSLVCAT